MGRSLSPTLLRELENLDKDPDSYKSAMRSLKSYVKDLDFGEIQIFLEQVFEATKIGSLSSIATSLYELLAQVHGAKIVPMIDGIMQSTVQTLASSDGSSLLQEACSKVVLAIARYGIDPTTAEDQKRNIICSLCKPLCDGLSSTHECLTSGAALCLKALVDSDNWRFASDEMVNKVCLKVAAALEGKSQTNSHMGLVMSLAMCNPLIVEAYARLLIQAGLRILDAGAEISEANAQKQFAAIQMVNFLMKYIDPKSIFSELEQIIEKMEICQFDDMAYVKDAAFEALQTARRIAAGKKSYGKSPASVTGSNFSRSDYMEADRYYGGEDHSPPASFSPEPQTLDFFPGYEYVVKSPTSVSQPSQHSKYSRSRVNRKLWSQENGQTDVSLRDGLFSAAAKGNAWLEQTENQFSNEARDLSDKFAGFENINSCQRLCRSTTPSPLRSRPGVNSNSMNMSLTPRKLFNSPEDPNEESSCCSNRQSRRFRNLLTSTSECSQRSNFKHDQNDFTDYVNCDCHLNGSLFDNEQFQDEQEPVSSTDEIPVGSASQVPPENSDNIETVRIQKPFQKTIYKVVCGLSFALLAIATPLLWITNQEDGHYLVPT